VLLERVFAAKGERVSGAIELAEVGGALAACDSQGRIAGCSPSARQLLSRLGLSLESLPAPIPTVLWQLIASRDVGVAVQWRSSAEEDLMLGCTRYRLGDDGWLLVMSEISHKQSLLAERLHQQRLEALGRLVATTAHDLRSPLSSIVFNSDVLAARIDELPVERVREAVGDINTAAARLRGTIDCLLDYVRLGPAVASEVSIREILTRTQSLLRPLLRAGAHRLLDTIGAEADRALGNPLAVEQIFVNLVLNSLEAARGPATVRVSSSLQGKLLRVLVEDDGPGIPSEHRLQVFDPFFTTKRDGTGIGLSAAREAARAGGGDVQLVRWTEGAAFAVLLPSSFLEGNS
jgi:signal transduction histidine kinase